MDFSPKAHCLALVLIGLMIGSARADIAVSMTPDTSHTGNNGIGYSLGYEFSTNEAISVTALGYFDSGSGLTDSHDVGIYDSNQNLLGSTTVTGSDSLADYFRYHTLGTSISLAANTDYYIAGVSGATDPYTYAPTSYSTSSAITFVSEQSAQSSTLAFPSSSETGSHDFGYFGPNFAFTVQAVPEPGSLVLVGIGVLAVGVSACHRRRRSRAV